MRSIVTTSRQNAELLDTPDFARHITPTDVRGRTLVSLVSPGTEINWGFLGNEFPNRPGYASVFQIEEVGSDVQSLVPGDLVLASGRHDEFQQTAEEGVVKLPVGLAPEIAVFARLMGVSMSTLNTTQVRAPERVLVTGLGPVGNLAAQIFSLCGYTVTAIDPVQSRRESALSAGLGDVRAALDNAPELIEQIGLHLECSGHEQAALDGCKAVRKRGEVVLVGVPWQKRTELSAFDILHAVFHRYVVLRSGWEWEVPSQPTPFIGNSIASNFAAALDWLALGRIKVGHLAMGYDPTDAQKVYSGLLGQSLPAPGAYFDWRK